MENKFKFVIPEKVINSQEKQQKFMNGKSYQSIISFIQELQSSVKGNVNILTEENIPKESNLNILMVLLKEATKLLIENPPLNKDKQRFGNIVFRTWYDKLNAYYDETFSNLVNSRMSIITNHEDVGKLSDEIKPYLFECFGNSKRIDYGTGHELNFILVLMILTTVGFINKNEYELAVKVVIKEYLQVCKSIQIEYNLEPAGSKGVYGLDDFFFIFFILGSAELIDNKEGIEPTDMQRDLTSLEKLAEKYMFFDACYYNLKCKKGHIQEHSPVLFQISNVPKWEKISNGLLKMWEDELLKKFVVTQHIHFGSIIKFE
jgi:serine/threonine-protein phosphatase 2A activator